MSWPTVRRNNVRVTFFALTEVGVMAYTGVEMLVTVGGVLLDVTVAGVLMTATGVDNVIRGLI